MIVTTDLRSVLAMLGVALGSLAAHAQVQTEAPPPVPGAKPVIVERIKVHGAALEGNLEGNAADRDVLVVLPPSYAKQKSRRYAVVYALHGYSIGAEQWSREIHLPQTIEGAFAQGAKEMIVVLPDSKTVHNGSMYSSSPTTGDFERFVARDLVVYCHFAFALAKPTSNVLFWAVHDGGVAAGDGRRSPCHRLERRVRMVAEW